jgi:hypothetical protein
MVIGKDLAYLHFLAHRIRIISNVLIASLTQAQGTTDGYSYGSLSATPLLRLLKFVKYSARMG